VSIDRRSFLYAGIGTAVFAGSKQVWAAASRKAQNRITDGTRNVLMICVEDLRDVLGCYGNPVVKTPNIDRFAAKGVRFERAYCQFPVCNPSRSSFLTGLRPDTIGVLNNVVSMRELNPDVKSLPGLFHDNGYHTIRLGKIFHGTGEHDDPAAWDQMFDPEDSKAAKTGESRNMTGGVVNWCSWMAAECSDSDTSDGKIADITVELLGKKRSKPFFIAAGFHKPHDPFEAPKKYFDMYPLNELVPPTDPSNRTPEPEIIFGSEWKKAFDKFTDRERKEFMRSYYACVSFTDAQIGKILDRLDRDNLWDNTIVLFLGDHGYNLGEHGWWNKNVLYDHSARVPMIVHVPGITKGGSSAPGIVELVDLYPTLAHLCGLEHNFGLEGISFAPLIAEPAREWKQAAFTQVQRGDTAGRSVRSKRWRYTEWGDGGCRGKELYDHNNDPNEYFNLIEAPSLEGVRKSMKELLDNGHNKIVGEKK
jgi:iduronate 2-sulfatase